MSTRLRRAVEVGLVGGGLFGAREALLTVRANGFVEPGRYFGLYVGGPLLAGMALGVVLAVCAVSILRRAPALPLAMAALAAGGLLSMVGPWIGRTLDDMRSVGWGIGWAGAAVLWGLGVTIAGAGAAVSWGLGVWYGERTARPLRFATPVALAVAVVAAVPVVRFFTSDWKLWSATVPTSGPAPGSRALPNVVLISIDTLRADHVGCTGSTLGLTPHLDRLGNEGVVFRQAITSAPWTLPAMASILTGLYPRHHGAGAIVNGRDPLGRSPLPAGTWTLSGALRAAGYRTQAMVTNPYLALRYGFGDSFDGYANLSIESEFLLAVRETTAFRLLQWAWPAPMRGDRGTAVSARGVRWLERAPAAQPFFLWLHYIDPHPPYARRGVTDNKSFRGDTLFVPRHGGPLDLALRSPDVARLRSGEIRLGAAEKEAVRSLYRAEVATVDAVVGEVLDALDRRGLRDDTLVIVVADHGEEFWEHGGVEHGHTVYDELVRVPLVLRLPGRLPAGMVVDDLVRTVDIAPTVTELLGIPPPPGADGESLMPVLRRAETEPRVAFIENMLFADERVGLRTASRKYVRWQTGKEEAYDLLADPGERRDLAGVASVIEPLRTAEAGFEARIQTARVAGGAARRRGGTVTALRSLGYVQ